MGSVNPLRTELSSLCRFDRSKGEALGLDCLSAPLRSWEDGNRSTASWDSDRGALVRGFNPLLRITMAAPRGISGASSLTHRAWLRHAAGTVRLAAVDGDCWQGVSACGDHV